MKTKFLLFACLFSFAFFVGCSSEDTNKTDESLVANKTISADDAVANSEIDASIDDVSIIVEDQFSVQQNAAFRTIEPVKSILPPCATITTVAGTDTYTRTIDFGTTGCAMPNGNVLKGKIIISFSKNTTAVSKTINYTLENFYHNDNLVEGSKSIVHEKKSTELQTAIHPVTTHSIDVKVTFPDAKVYTRVGTHVREMTEGFATMGNWEDNVFMATGSHVTNFPNGSKFTTTIQTPLVFKSSCRMPFPVQGTVKITKNEVEAILDYGTGECDNLATMTTGGVTKEIELQRKKK